jgi:DNA-directed RNA polymerase specialized sigma24 family protein
MIEPTSLNTTSEVGVASPFEDFFIAEHERLFKALFMLTGNPEDADDLAQEALLRAYERWDRVCTMDSPVGYVYRTALNMHRNRLRGRVSRLDLRSELDFQCCTRMAVGPISSTPAPATICSTRFTRTPTRAPVLGTLAPDAPSPSCARASRRSFSSSTSP